jgi:hypothetical protein
MAVIAAPSKETFDRRELRKAYRPINEFDVWRSRFNYEHYLVYNELEVVKMMRAGKVR